MRTETKLKGAQDYEAYPTEEDEEFKELGVFLTNISPNLTSAALERVLSRVKIGNYTEYEYYGNYTEYGYKLILQEEVFEALEQTMKEYGFVENF